MKLINNPNLLWYVIIYGIVMVVMGIIYSKKIKNSDDFILAGRGLGPLILMGTLIATWCGSGTITGGPASMAYKFGFWPSLLFVIPSLIGISILYIIGNKIRAYGKYTVAEILETKYGSFARTLAGIIIALAFVGIVSYQFKGIGFVLNITTGLSVDLGTIIGAFLIIFLATIGGLMSVAPTDALSAFLVIFGLLIAIPAVLTAGGGWSNICANVPPEHLTVTGPLNWVQMIGFYLPLLMLLLGDQNMYQRLSASNSNKTTKSATIGWFIGLLIINPVVTLIAFAGSSLFKDIPAGMALISTTLVIPQFIGGILLAAISAFIITTGNSYLLSAATNITYDIYAKYFNPKATDKQKLNFTKILIPILGIIAFVMIRFFPSVLSIQMYAYTVYGAGITPALLAVFFWKRVNKAGGIASMFTGVISTLIWEIPLSRPYGLNSALISVPLAIIALIIATLLTSKPASNE